MIATTSRKIAPLSNIFRTLSNKTRNVSNDIPSFRQNFKPRTEQQLNFQIGQELMASHAYLAMANFFGRTEIALQGSSSFFRAMSDEEREHAMSLIDYQNMRGGKVKMIGVEKPNEQFKDEFSSLSAAIEESLLIERGNAATLSELVRIAESDGDIATVDFICTKFLHEQMSALQNLGNILMRLKRFEQKGLGEYLIDQEFLKDYQKKG
ncbi:soma ferritin-like [Bradysia coprophila]|uniref:soma ferritin-like n=1 Tax=Bradysia coprophila TaxID=38358 RepID=UPI00187D9C11|nr:soma ferritin-like [Bradysia coprophila]